MQRTRFLLALLVVGPLASACGTSSPPTRPIDGSVPADGGTGDSGVNTGTLCSNGSPARSEGTVGSPVTWALAALPGVGHVHVDDGPSFYRISGLTVGSRYRMDVSAGIYGRVQLLQSADATKVICESDTLYGGGSSCLFVPQATTIDVRVTRNSGTSGGVCFNVGVALDSPVGSFEGATDNLRELRFGTSDLPHLGRVDHLISYYRVTQLVPGRRYKLYITSLESSPNLLIGREDPLQGLVNTGCNTGYSNTGSNVVEDRYCMFTATATTQAFAVSEGYGASSGSRYVISVFEDFESEGTAAAPVAIPYAGGVERPSHVGGAVAPALTATSYYEITGVTPGARYLVAVTDGQWVRVGVHADTTYSIPLVCTNFEPTASCDVTASGTSLYISVRGSGPVSKDFTLQVHPHPSDEGSSASPLALTYPTDLPREVQADFSGEYLVSGLPTGLMELTFRNQDAPVSFSAWPMGGASIACGVSASSPRCLLSASAAGQIRVRVDGPAHFELLANPAPVLTSTHVRNVGRVEIPNGDPNGLTDPLTVNGSPVTSIQAATVELYLRHGYTYDVAAYLTAPDGTIVQLANKGGGHYTGVVYTDYDLATQHGSYLDVDLERRPIEPLHRLTGMDANGTWTLRVVDDANPNISDNGGELLGWGMSFR